MLCTGMRRSKAINSHLEISPTSLVYINLCIGLFKYSILSFFLQSKTEFAFRHFQRSLSFLSYYWVRWGLVMVGNCFIFKCFFVVCTSAEWIVFSVLTSSNFICLFYFLWIFLGKCLHVVTAKFFLYYCL